MIAEALKGVEGTTALHMCFGYAAIHAWQGLGKPDAYSFLPELNESDIDQISIEAAQPRIDLAVAGEAAGQDHHPGRHRQRRPRDRIARKPSPRASGRRSTILRPSGSSWRPIAA